MSFLSLQLIYSISLVASQDMYFVTVIMYSMTINDIMKYDNKSIDISNHMIQQMY